MTEGPTAAAAGGAGSPRVGAPEDVTRGGGDAARVAPTRAPEDESANASGGSPVRRRLFPRSPAARSALFHFALTRLIVLTIIVVGGQINIIAYGSGDTARELRLWIGKVPITRIVYETMKVADINWYYQIAENGYERRPFDATRQHNWAFFPLFPLVWRAASRLTGETIFTGLLLSNLFFLAALFTVYGAAREFGLDDAEADRALFYLAAFPTSYFFSLPMTESLFLLLASGSFYAAKRRAWWLAGVLGALASATRVVGVLLLPALAILYFQTYGRDWRRPRGLWLCLIPTGILSFMYYLYRVTGNPFAFKDVLVTWGRSPGLFVLTLVEYLKQPTLIAVPWDFRLLNFVVPTLALACGVVLVKRREWALAAFTLLTVVAALSSLALQSQARYAMAVFPLYFVLARATRGRPRLDQAIRAVSLVLLGLLTAMFAAHFSMAMA